MKPSPSNPNSSKSLLALALLILLSAIYAANSWRHSHAFSLRRSGSSTATDFSEPKTSDHTSKRMSSTAGAKANDESQNLNEDSDASAAEKCWRKVNDQVPLGVFTNSNIRNFEKVVGAWYFLPKENNEPRGEEESSSGKFLLALARAGLLQGGPKIEQDDQEALDLLSEVASEDPKNSAPFAFAAIIENRLHHPDQAKEWMKKAEQTDHFDSYMKDVSRAIYGQVKSPSDLLEGMALWSRTPVPDYISLKHILVDTGQKAIARQMLADGLNENTTDDDLDWFSLDYAIGHSVLKNLDKDVSEPSWHDVLNKKKVLAQIPGESGFAQLEKTCDLNSLEPEVIRIQKHLNGETVVR